MTFVLLKFWALEGETPYIRRTGGASGLGLPWEGHLGTLLPPITPDCPFFHFRTQTNVQPIKSREKKSQRSCLKKAIVMFPSIEEISPWHACTRWSTPARYLYDQLQSSTARGRGRRSRRRTQTGGRPTTSSRGSATTCSRLPSHGNTFACSQCSPRCDTWKDLSHNLSVCTRLTNQFGRKTFGNISQRSWPIHISAAHYTAALSSWMI